MPRRPALTIATAALFALSALTACQGSPEAGHPNTTPVSSPSTPSPTPSAPSTPAWTTQQRAAIAAAQARYSAARGAVANAFENPRGAKREALEAAGNGGAWLASILERLVFLQEHALYQDGSGRILSTSPSSVDLTAEQPTVVLKTCIDGTGVQMRYQSTGKPVPVATTVGGGRRGVSARFVYARANTGTKMWFLVEEKSAAAC
jgi:hypothetical protein